MASERARLRIDGVATGGDGVARLDGLAVFVPRAVTGDVVDANIERRRRFARGTVREIVEPSPSRVAPRCRHYDGDRCGGCQLQHVRYDEQLEIKRTIIRDAFTRLARRPIERPEIVPAADPWHYRAKLTLAMRRWGDDWTMGLRVHDEPDTIFALEECPITDDRVLAVWREIRAAAALLPSATRLRGAVRVSAHGASLVLEGGGTWDDPAAFVAHCPSIDVLWWQPEHGPRERVHDRRVTGAPDAAFGQVNPAVAAAMHAHVIALATTHAPRHVVDAYAGVGETAVALAERGIRVTAIERDTDATAWLSPRLPAPSRVIAGSVERTIAAALPADVVLLNPPRTGVDAAVTSALASRPTAAPVIIYASCDPATLARDVARLTEWRIASVRAFDMFPQTAHVETVCELVWNGGATHAQPATPTERTP